MSIASTMGVDILRTARQADELIKKAFAMEGVAEEDIPRVKAALEKTLEMLSTK